MRTFAARSDPTSLTMSNAAPLLLPWVAGAGARVLDPLAGWLSGVSGRPWNPGHGRLPGGAGAGGLLPA